MNARATFIDENGNKLELQGEAAVAMAMQKRPYKGVTQLKPLPWLNPKYRRKNMSGGLLCQFTQSAEYKRKPSHWRSETLPSGIVPLATPWHGWEER